MSSTEPSPTRSPRAKARKARIVRAPSPSSASDAGRLETTTGPPKQETGIPNVCPWCGEDHKNPATPLCHDRQTQTKTYPPKREEVKKDAPKAHFTPHGVRYFKIGEGYDLDQMKRELDDYMDVLLGRQDPPIDVGVMTLMEVAEAYHARACEIEMELKEMEAEGVIMKGTRLYHFRTGKLRTFIELTNKTIDLGSRRVTWEKELHSRG